MASIEMQPHWLILFCSVLFCSAGCAEAVQSRGERRQSHAVVATYLSTYPAPTRGATSRFPLLARQQAVRACVPACLLIALLLVIDFENEVYAAAMLASVAGWHVCGRGMM